jgi:DNA polymerase V
MMNHLEFEWSPAKAASNLKKHGVSFEEARTAFEDEEALLIPDPEHTLLLRVAGESMEGAGIRHGDLLVVERQRRAKPGQVVVALVDGGFTLKRLIWRHNRWWLEAAHPAYPPLELGEGRLWGVATQVIRTLATPINTHTSLRRAPWAQPSC